jgi:hypothetical protein
MTCGPECYSPFVRYNVRVMDEQKRTGALLIAASIIAAVRLRGVEIKPCPAVSCAIADSVKLARMVLEKIEKGG